MAKRYRRSIHVQSVRMNKQTTEGLIRMAAALVLIVLMVMQIRSLLFGRTKVSVKNEDIAAFRIPVKTLSLLKNISEVNQVDFTAIVTVFSLENSFFPDKGVSMTQEQLERNFYTDFETTKSKFNNAQYQIIYTLLRGPLTEIKVFPIPTGYDSEEVESYMFGDSWGSVREYGGKRIHLGCDIADRENVRGRIPVVSMTDGVIEKLGWNEKGGWRVGVRSESGVYYYYAHLDSYATSLAEGMSVLAGTHLGYMGDTGYSKKEGTYGNFPVHLHIGIQIDTDLTNDEFWLNPYPFLRLVEANKVPRPY